MIKFLGYIFAILFVIAVLSIPLGLIVLVWIKGFLGLKICLTGIILTLVLREIYEILSNIQKEK